MNTKFFLSIVTVVVLLTHNSCTKDYPKDIPDWLKCKIKELKKESRGNGCINDVCMEVQEYSDGQTTIFLFQPGATPIGYKVYDESGIEQCYFETTQPPTCGAILGFQNYQFVRQIWTEN